MKSILPAIAAVLTLSLALSAQAQNEPGTAYAYILSDARVSPTYQQTPGGTSVTATREATGAYNVAIPGLSVSSGWAFQVNAYGSGNA